VLICCGSDRALRGFGDDPNHAHVRSPKIVENYEQ
jgi:hypothetical protein